MASSSHIGGDEKGTYSIVSTEVGGMVNAPSSQLQLKSVPTSGGSPLVERETTKFDNWSLELGLHLTSVEARKVRAFIRSYRSCFAFSLHDLKGYKGKPIHIQLEDNHPIFWRPYRLSVSKRIGIQAHCQELLAARLIKLSNGEYACVVIMPSKKDIFGNWTEKRMCGDYR